MKIIKMFILLFSLLLLDLNAEGKRELVFAPLPIKGAKKTIEEFLPLTTEIEKKLDGRFRYRFLSNYDDIIKGFIDNSIDIAYLGPLPYLNLKQRYPHIKPIVSFKQQDGTATYKCGILKFVGDQLDTSKPLKVALTQPLSTCGYYMTQILLKQKFDIELVDQQFDYEKTHTKALLSVLKQKYHLAGAKDSVYNKFKSLGMELILSSESLYGFTLVVNTKTLDTTNIEELKQAILEIPKVAYSQWDGVISNGYIEADEKEYLKLDVDFNKIPDRGNIDEN